MDYDESRIYYSYQNLQTNPNGRNDDTNNNEENEIEDLDLDNVNLHAAKRHFREFLREFLYRISMNHITLLYSYRLVYN